jgi:hypothetical protein
MTAANDLVEIEQIKKLKARYFRNLDTKNWAEWRNVFADDLTVRVDVTVTRRGQEAVTPPLPEGADAFVAHMSDYLDDAITVHHGHMPEIDVTGPDTARGIWAMEDVVEMTDGRMLRGYGHYHEEYRRQGGEWRIASIHLTRLRLDYSGPWPTGDDFVKLMHTMDA